MREEQSTVEPYEPPALVELGVFSDDTLGIGFTRPDMGWPRGVSSS
ncbi:lasso RiPP family leader peptide-containing protein [Amycolatopsis anabasis]|nr:lasso RiPP family leader peptide-containing protein [Amycolatopsis anabasis]